MCTSIITDSRQRFTVIDGLVICVGHVSEAARPKTKMKLLHTRAFAETVERLEQRGYKINYEWA